MKKPESISLYKSEEARDATLSSYEEALRSWPAGPEGSRLERLWLETGAGRTAVFAPGSKSSAKPPLLLLHGTLSNSAMWLGEAELLGRERRLFAVDIPGEPGLSEERRLDWQGDGAARWLAEVVAGLGLGEHELLGLSIGGWIALNYAIGAPGGLRSLTLLSPSGLGRTRPSFIIKAMLQMPRGRAGYEAIARSLYGENPPPEGALRFGTELSMRTNARMEKPRIFSDAEIAGIEARLFLAVGEKDVMLRSSESARRLGRLQEKAEIQLLPGAGHALLGLGGMIVDFLDR
jgi:pimeloyl-ACP methyl ester carboxylesterase